MTKKLKQKRKVYDAEDTSWSEILQHVLVNFIFGVTGGIVIAFVALFINDTTLRNALLLCLFFFIHKQFESKVLNRNKYVTKLGKNYIYPIPSTIGFVLGAYISIFI